MANIGIPVGEGGQLFLTGMCEYEIERNGSFF